MGSVRAGTMGAIAPIEFSEKTIPPVNFPNIPKKKRKSDSFSRRSGSSNASMIRYGHKSYDAKKSRPKKMSNTKRITF